MAASASEILSAQKSVQTLTRKYGENDTRTALARAALDQLLAQQSLVDKASTITDAVDLIHAATSPSRTVVSNKELDLLASKHGKTVIRLR